LSLFFFSSPIYIYLSPSFCTSLSYFLSSLFLLSNSFYCSLTLFL
jgi:hypothetical protein